MTDADAVTYARTLRSLHGVAELLLAGPQRRADRSIKLTVTDDGFATGELPAAPWRIEVSGLNLIVGATQRRTIPLRGTFADVAQQAGLVAEPPVNSYSPASECEPDDEIAIDADACAELLAALRIGRDACVAMSARHAASELPVLWPEHFDVGITIGAINYGVSPGDDAIPRPYAYVGPHVTRSGEFWNQPFGAARAVAEYADAAGVLTFFEEGRRQADG